MKIVFYELDGQRIHVKEEGPENRTVALMIHGWSSSWYAVSPMMELISDRYRCLAVDLPGYGQSPKLPQRASIKAYADVLAKLLKEVTDQPAVLIGHSMGGMISLTMAIHYPELVERLVLICPTVTGKLSMYINLFVSPVTIVERSGVADWFVSLFEPHMLQVTDRLMKPASFANNTSITDDEYHKLRFDARRPGQGRVRAECYWAMRENDLSGQLGEISAPSLILWGMEDNTVPLRDASVVASEFPDADLRIIPNAGHWPQFEARETTERYISGFLATPIKLLKLDFDS